MPRHDPALGTALRLPLVHYRAARYQRVARIHPPMEGQTIDPEKKPARLAQVLDREPKDRRENQHRVDHDLAMAMGAGVRLIEVERVVAQGQRTEERVVALVERASPMMPKDLANREILVKIALGELPRPQLPVIAHCDTPKSLINCELLFLSGSRAASSGPAGRAH